MEASRGAKRALCLALAGTLVVLLSPMPTESARGEKQSSKATSHRATDRLAGGNVAPEGSWPSQVALLGAEAVDPYDAQFCAGTLVFRKWVLTSAQCVTDPEGRPIVLAKRRDPRNLRRVASPSEIDVAVGFRDLDDIRPSDRRSLASIAVHPDFRWVMVGEGWAGNYIADWDFALLELEAPASRPRTPLVSPDYGALSDPGQRAMIAGWGCTSRFSSTSCPSPFPDLLQQAEVSLLEASRCGASSAYGARFSATSMLCAGGTADGVPDTCIGDGGGPLDVAGPGETKVLVGITSWGHFRCGTAGYPGVFSRVLAARDWILETVQPSERELTVKRAGLGSGTVESSPSAISCGSSCSARFKEESLVVLRAVPTGDSRFAGWKGGCSGREQRCVLTLGEATEVTARFVDVPWVTVSTRPAKRTRKRSAIFHFSAPEADSTFRCRLGGKPWEACSSPKTYRRLERGRKYVFRVEATVEELTGPIATRRWFVKNR